MSLLHDLRLSIRILLKHPGFVITTTLILALGIGANTTIFSVVNTILMRPLPYVDPDRIVMIWETNQPRAVPRSIVSPANFLDWKEQNQVFDDLAAFRFWYYTVTGSGDPERYQGARVSASFFPLLGVKPEIGRNFGAEEEQVGQDRVVMLSHALWQRRFGGEPNVIGRPLTIDGESFTIIGVLPASFRFTRVLNAELELCWGVDILNAIVPENRLPRLEKFSLDLRVLGFTLLVSILAGVIVGLVPGLRTSRLNLSETLKEGGRVLSEAPSGRRLRNLFVVLEITLTVPLLISAGLMLRSSLLLQNMDRGINLQDVLTMQISLPPAKYSTAEQMAAFYHQTLQRIQTQPGVESVSAVNVLPLTNLGDATALAIEGVTPPPPGQELTVSYRVIDQNYFRTMGISLLQGRYFTEQDNDESHGVVMINKTMALRYWPNENPVGSRLKPQFPAAKVPWRPESTNTWLTVVGVVGDVKEDALNDQIEPEIYVPYLQNPSSLMNLLVRSASDPLRLGPSLRSQVLAVDRDQPVTNINTMEDVFSQSLAEPKLVASLLATFAALALVLATLGVYSVISYSVAQRAHEIGIRMAMGAQQRHVLRMIVGQGLRLVLVGVAVGLALAFAVTRVLSNLLFGVTATDPPIFVAVPLLLLAVAIFASYFPARKALKVDPIIALRSE